MRRKKDYTFYSIIVYGHLDNQVAIGRYCDKDGGHKCYRIYHNGQYMGTEYDNLEDAAAYIDKTARQWNSKRVWRNTAEWVPYTGLKFGPAYIFWRLIGGPLPGWNINNKLKN